MGSLSRAGLFSDKCQAFFPGFVFPEKDLVRSLFRSEPIAHGRLIGQCTLDCLNTAAQLANAS